MLFFLILPILPLSISAQLDLNSIKKQQTYPSVTATTVAFPSTTTSTISTTVGRCNIGCQDGWIPYGGNCYTKIDETLAQSTAEQECIDLGGHLASLESVEESNAIRSLVLAAPLFSGDLLSFTSSSENSWIGLSKESDGSWKWSDSSDFGYTNLPNESSISGESCVSMNISGTWQSNDCSSTLSSFICKRKSALSE
uniref:C-type lectin domain-containing protein n=1 Tax=Caenorhabditis tropicalis TaxID=1561998 RepID=A0A1I7TP53_9PELO